MEQLACSWLLEHNNRRGGANLSGDGTASDRLARLLLVALSVSALNLNQRRLAVLFLLAALAIAGLEIWGIASRLVSLF